MKRFVLILVIAAAATGAGDGAVEPQVRTDHLWFPGELSCSTFERLFATQAKLYERETGRKADTDEDKARPATRRRGGRRCTGAAGRTLRLLLLTS